MTLTQPLAQASKPVAQTHRPLSHAPPMPQLCPHAPQLVASDDGLVHAPPHESSPGGQQPVPEQAPLPAAEKWSPTPRSRMSPPHASSATTQHVTITKIAYGPRDSFTNRLPGSARRMKSCRAFSRRCGIISSLSQRLASLQFPDPDNATHELARRVARSWGYPRLVGVVTSRRTPRGLQLIDWHASSLANLAAETDNLRRLPAKRTARADDAFTRLAGTVSWARAVS
jgi:hypothetical protein